VGTLVQSRSCETVDEAYVKSAPVTLGKHRIGIMSKTKIHATLPIALEYFPRFHGPGLKRLPTKKTRMKIGMVNALTDVSEDFFHSHQYLHKSRDSTNGKQCSNCQFSAKYEQQAQYANYAVEPNGICRCLRVFVDPLPVFG
jgi:hypothetical protein